MVFGFLRKFFGRKRAQVIERVEYRTDPALLQRLDDMNKKTEEAYKQLQAANEDKLRALEEARGYKMDAEEKQRALEAMEDPAQFASMRRANFENMLKSVIDYPIEASMPAEFRGKINIGFIGITACGKSTLINTLAKRKVAETGIGETTKEVSLAWSLDDFCYWDFPGYNDQVDYFDIKYIAFVKAFSMMYLLYDSDLKVCLNLMRLLQALKVPYALIRTKCDSDENARKTNLGKVAEELKAVRKREGETLTLNTIIPAPRIYHVSCRNARNSMKILDYDPDEIVGGLYDWHELVRDMASLKPAS